MSRGLINPDEPWAIILMKVMIQGGVKKAKEKGEVVCFSVPGAPSDGPADLLYRVRLVKGFLQALGYEAKSINAGLAVVFTRARK